MNPAPDFQLPQRATDPHAFPTTRDDWYGYRRWLVQYGDRLDERMNAAPTLAERDAARREWDALRDLSRDAEVAFEEFKIAQEDAEYAEHVAGLTSRIWSDWVSADSVRAPRDASRHVLTALVYEGEPGSEVDEGPDAGRPVGLDEHGRRLSATMYKLDTPPDSRVLRLPRANVLVLVEILEEFAARLMLARTKGELVEGDDYIRAVIELQADLESRRFGD